MAITITELALSIYVHKLLKRQPERKKLGYFDAAL